MVITEGQVITPRSSKHHGSPKLFDMQPQADKLSVDSTQQIECKVESIHRVWPPTDSDSVSRLMVVSRGQTQRLLSVSYCLLGSVSTKNLGL